MSRALEVLLVFLRLGLTSFGGPVAHLGYFRKEFVERRRWLDEPTYAGIVGAVPVPARPGEQPGRHGARPDAGGLPGALAAFIGFTAPSAALMIAFAYLMTSLGNIAQAPWIHGLKLAAVAVVAQAVWSMARSLTPDAIAHRVRARRRGDRVAPAVVRRPDRGDRTGRRCRLALARERRSADAASCPCRSVARFLGFARALFPVADRAAVRGAAIGHPLALIDGFYRTGALVFGGGHVVLPLLQKGRRRAGSTMRRSSPAMARRRRCPGRSFPSRPFSAPR